MFTSHHPPRKPVEPAPEPAGRAAKVMDELKMRFSHLSGEMLTVEFKPANPALHGNDSYVLTTAPTFSRDNLKKLGLTEYSKERSAYEEADFFKDKAASHAGSAFTISSHALEKALDIEFPGQHR